MLFLCAIIFIIYKCARKYSHEIHKIFVAIMIPIGMLYLIFLIPGQAPDEDAHYERVYEISTGIFISGTNQDKIPISYIPEDLLNIDHENITNYNKMIEESFEETDWENKTEAFSLTRGYFPIMYIVPAIAMFIARSLNFNVIYALYFVRMANFIVFLIMGYYTIKIIPFGKMVLMTYFFIPMVIHQGVAISLDSIVNSLLLLFIAFILNLYFKENSVTHKEKIIFLIFSFLIAFAKTVYMPLIFISLILLYRKQTKNNKEKFLNKILKRENLYIIIGISICIIVTLLWFIYVNRFKDNRNFKSEDTFASQTFSVVNHPIEFIKILFNTLSSENEDMNYKYYIKTFIGSRLAWLDIRIDETIVLIYLILLVLSPFFGENEVALNVKQRFLLLSIFLVCSLLIFLAMYVSWSQTRIDCIAGVQGRYFTPLFILLLLCMCYKKKDIFKDFNFLYYATLIIDNILVVSEMAKFFM